MKITITGTINRDIIRFHDGRTLESPGGLMYSILTFAELAPKDCIIFPVVNVGHDIYDNVCEILGRYAQINLSGLNKCDCPNNAVYLNIDADNERDEHTELYLPQIDFLQVEPHLDSAIIMLNLTSGFEFDPSVVEKVVRSAGGLTYIDIHSLTLGIDKKGHRIRRKLNDDAWYRNSDFVQLTENETWSFHHEKEHNQTRAFGACRKIASMVKKTCLMTRGSVGVAVFARSGEYVCETDPVEKVIDTTGCGDVFGASFLLHYVKTRNMLESVRYGIYKAGVKCGFSGIADITKLK